MRSSCALLVGLALLPVGCSALIAQSGKDVTSLKTREQVRREFGAPTESGTTADGHAYDDFRTRRKISDVDPAAGLCFVMSFGLSEFVAFPEELYENEQRLLLGQTLRFEYDATGNVTWWPIRNFLKQPNWGLKPKASITPEDKPIATSGQTEPKTEPK
jgi:hypothetical protein